MTISKYFQMAITTVPNSQIRVLFCKTMVNTIMYSQARWKLQHSQIKSSNSHGVVHNIFSWEL
jgi:hypothetical protein